MKVLFLDIDGVLNSYPRNQHMPNDSESALWIDEKAVSLLQKIIRQTGAVLVLHSGWRMWFDRSLQPVSPETKHFCEMLRKYDLALYDMTPDMTTEEIRATKQFSLVKAKEIKAWLHAHEDATQYLILDDLDLHDAELAKVQIQTDPASGLTPKETKRAIELLNQE